MKEKLIISAGDPAGCGLKVTLSALLKLKTNADIFLSCDQEQFSRQREFRRLKNRLTVIDAKIKFFDKIVPGCPSKQSGQAALTYLDNALSFMKANNIKRLVTAPLSKEAVALVYKGFCGHTEYLAEFFKVKKFAMMMVANELRLVLLTRHILLKDVSSKITAKLLAETLSVVGKSLKENFALDNPRLAFVSVNPHASVATFLGEEERLMFSVSKKFKNVFGPFPADTVFIPDNLKKYDCFICSYHDQGMVAFKILAFKSGVNFTAGLPIIRTSPAHGTAFDLIAAGKEPDCSSMLAALKLALELKV